MTDDLRAQIDRHLVELKAVALAPDDNENRKARLGLVAQMLMAYPVAGTQEAGRARAEAYLAALDDLPPWAVADAIRRWHRGECGDGYNYRWAPAPAELRGIARQPLEPALDAIRHLQDVLEAPSIEEAMDPKWTKPTAQISSERGQVLSLTMRRA